MIKLLKKIKLWANSNGKMILVSVLSVILIALPFVGVIITVTSTIENETVYMILDLILFVLFGITYVSFTKLMNKL
jgi:hypothetical protein